MGSSDANAPHSAMLSKSTPRSLAMVDTVFPFHKSNAATHLLIEAAFALVVRIGAGTVIAPQPAHHFG